MKVLNILRSHIIINYYHLQNVCKNVKEQMYCSGKTGLSSGLNVVIILCCVATFLYYGMVCKFELYSESFLCFLCTF